MPGICAFPDLCQDKKNKLPSPLNQGPALEREFTEMSTRVLYIISIIVGFLAFLGEAVVLFVYSVANKELGLTNLSRGIACVCTLLLGVFIYSNVVDRRT